MSSAMRSNNRLFEEARAKTASWIEPLKRANALLDENHKEEMAILDQLNPGMDTIPNWGMLVYNDLPDWGREPCAHRWTDGLFELLEMIAQEKHWPLQAGRCGDMPGRVALQVEALAASVEGWRRGEKPSLDLNVSWVNSTLGEHNPEKDEAAACFVELARAAFLHSKESWDPVAAGWRDKAAGNETLERLFFEGGLDEKLECACGFLLIHRLKDYITLIGGDATPLPGTRWWCNSMLREAWRQDPNRVLVTQGCLWGLYAALAGMDEDSLRRRAPWCAGAAIRALQILKSSVSARPPLRHWLITSMLIKTRHWYLRMLNFANDGTLPEPLWDVPDLRVIAPWGSGDGVDDDC